MTKFEDGVLIRRNHWLTMRDHVAACMPEEGCGLLAGVGERVLQVMPMENVAHRTDRYLIGPEQQLQAFRAMASEGWELLAIYHSHPAGPPHPSASDVAEAYYPEALSLIWTPPGTADWECRAYRIGGGGFVEVELAVV